MTGDPLTPAAPWPADPAPGRVPCAPPVTRVPDDAPHPDRFAAMLHAVVTGLVAGIALGAVAGGTVLLTVDGEPSGVGLSSAALLLSAYGAVVGGVVGASFGTLFGVASGLAAAALPPRWANRTGGALAFAAVWALGGLLVALLAPAPDWVSGAPLEFALLCEAIGAALGATAPPRCPPMHPAPRH